MARKPKTNRKKLWDKLDEICKKIVKEEANRKCERCGVPSGQWSHVKPKSLGIIYRWNPLNIMWLCYACHINWWHNNPIPAAKWFKKKYPGRWSSNLILSESAAAMLDQQSGVSKSTASVRNNKKRNEINIYGNGKGIPQVSLESPHNDSGGASRFFYIAKASRSERNAGLEGMEKGEPPASARSKPAEGRESPLGKPRENFHPTVKPLKLMEYLCLLTKTPTGGVVLDPFMGSGTTGIACVNTGRDFIGIEKEKDYFEIARRRIEHVKKIKNGQIGLFDESIKK